MKEIFYLKHSYMKHGSTDRKGIGVFSTRAAAEAAITQVRNKAGFRDYLSGFSIHACVIGRAYLPAGLDKEDTNINIVSVPSERATSATYLYLLYNQSTVDDAEHDEDFVLIGYYPTMAAAQVAANDLKSVAELARPNREFDISISAVNRINWSEGFVDGVEALKRFQ